MTVEPTAARALRAFVDFACQDQDCGSAVRFNLMQLRESKGRVACAVCHREYHFEPPFVSKLECLRELILAVMRAEDILGEASIVVTTPAGDVKMPYRLLLTRLNSIITLDVGGRKVDFNFRIEPLKDGVFK
jgi:hypothetical protein